MIETEQRRALKGQGGGAATVGWDNPPIPWDEFERRLTWRARSADPDHNNQAAGRRPVTWLHSRKTAQKRQDHQIPWAELHCHSCYSFLDGASQPAELVAEAARRGVRFLDRKSTLLNSSHPSISYA